MFTIQIKTYNYRYS